MQPPLDTHRLALRPARSSDVDELWALWTDDRIRRYLWDDREITRDEAAATLADCLALADQGLGLWLVMHRAAPIGCAALLPVSTAAEYEPRLAGLVEPLVALRPSAWGQGFAQEALGALLTHASAGLGLTQLAGVSDVPNVASDRMLRRAGFKVLSETAGPRYPLRTYLWRAPFPLSRPR